MFNIFGHVQKSLKGGDCMNKKERIFTFTTKYGEIVSDEMINWLDSRGYFDAPASSKYHGAFRGGLMIHSMNVTDTLLEYTEKLDLRWQRKESPYYIGLFHDLCKMDEYKENKSGYSRVESKNLPLVGHGDKSIMIICQQLALTEEEIFCIRYHMGAYQTDDWKQLDSAIEKYPNVLYTHMADMYASKILDDKETKTINADRLCAMFLETKEPTSNYEEYREKWLDEGFIITS